MKKATDRKIFIGHKMVVLRTNRTKIVVCWPNIEPGISRIIIILEAINTYLFTYLRTQWNRVLLDKLSSSQLVMKFPAFYGTRRFFTAFTSTHYLSLS